MLSLEIQLLAKAKAMSRQVRKSKLKVKAVSSVVSKGKVGNLPHKGPQLGKEARVGTGLL